MFSLKKQINLKSSINQNKEFGSCIVYETVCLSNLNHTEYWGPWEFLESCCLSVYACIPNTLFLDHQTKKEMQHWPKRKQKKKLEDLASISEARQEGKKQSLSFHHPFLGCCWAGGTMFGVGLPSSDNLINTITYSSG